MACPGVIGKVGSALEGAARRPGRGNAGWRRVSDQGRVQVDWAEVVFENGDTRVVDMKEWTRERGLYGLLDFADGRKVDHVRVVARAKSYEARVVLKMEK